MKLRHLTLFALALSFSTSTEAATIYTLNLNYAPVQSDATVLLQFSTPSILTASAPAVTSILSSSTTGNLSGCTAQFVDVENPSTSSSSITITYTPCGSGHPLDFQTPISSDGTYTAFFNFTTTSVGTLTVSSTPEPATVWIFGSGLLGFLAMVRSRARRSRSTEARVEDLV